MEVMARDEHDALCRQWRDQFDAMHRRAMVAEARVGDLEAERDSPEVADFMRGVPLEAEHQRARWGAAHDAGKAPEDWFWLLGYLGGKALAAAKAGDLDKAKHHTISSAAALANWHAALTGADMTMRPGIDPVERGIEPQRAGLTRSGEKA